VAPHVAARETHQRPQDISFVIQKGLFQHYRPDAEVNMHMLPSRSSIDLAAD